MLAIDFGTTNTVASIGDATGVRTLTIDGKTIMPSAVFLTEGRLGRNDGWLVGDAAINMARAGMEWFEATPKYFVADETLLLGDRTVPVTEAVAAVLRVVVNEAASQIRHQPPAKYVITHPAGWPESKIGVLKEAARQAAQHRGEWPEPEPLPEPQAAAQAMLVVEGLQQDARIVVLDLGGGTADVAIVDRAGPALAVVGRPIGMEGAAGEDFDFRLAEWMTEEVGVRGLYRQLADSGVAGHREQAMQIRGLARSIKEELSRRPVVPAQLSRLLPDLGQDVRVQVSRPQLEQLIRGGPGKLPGLTEAVGLVGQILASTPQGPPFAGVYLVGGSSRIPLLGALVQQQVQREPIIGGDPSTAVANGAAEYARAQLRRPVRPNGSTEPSSTQTASSAFPRVLLRPLLVVLLLAGGVFFVSWLLGHIPPFVNPLGSGPVNPPTSTIAPPPVSNSASPPENDLLTACSSPAVGDCSSRILAGSRAVWPTMPSAGCSVHGPLYGADRFSAECRTGETSYLVFWRESGSVISQLTGQMLMPTLRDFVLPDSAQKLGSQAFGTRSTPTGDRFTCAWEYADEPVTMVIDGPNDNGTLSVCGQAMFLDRTALEMAIRDGA